MSVDMTHTFLTQNGPYASYARHGWTKFNRVAVVGLKANHQSTAVPSPINGARMPLPKSGAAANLDLVGPLEFPDVDLGKNGGFGAKSPVVFFQKEHGEHYHFHPFQKTEHEPRNVFFFR